MNGYCYFLLGLVLLALGYIFYGRFIERVYRPDEMRVTPAVAMPDGVDYVVLPKWRMFLIQLLNIAGLGPIFGAVLGVLYGPSALLWIVFGCIFGGMVHDYFAGMISLRHKGENLPEMLGYYLGKRSQWVSRVVCIVFSVLVAVVFAVGPAAILGHLTGWDVTLWVYIIFGYYFLATILPIQAIIGKLYPWFAAALIVMVVGILGVLLLMPFADMLPASWGIPSGEVLPDVNFFANEHPTDLPLFPMVFITIACGAISGFHATQSPLMGRCMEAESQGRPIFSGAMIVEGMIALIWAVAILTFYGNTDSLQTALTAAKGSPAVPIQAVSEAWMGHVGSVLVMIGVVILPISTGDGALRVARLMIADSFRLNQSQVSRRLMIAIPLFVAAIVVSRLDYQVIWQYFGWINQLLAAATLWAIVVFLRKHRRLLWVAVVPALFLTMVGWQYLMIKIVGTSDFIGILCSSLISALMLGLALYLGREEVVRVPRVAVESTGDSEGKENAHV